jgi:hypothetical protein
MTKAEEARILGSSLWGQLNHARRREHYSLGDTTAASGSESSGIFRGRDRTVLV